MDTLIVMTKNKMEKEIKDWHLMRWSENPGAKEAVSDFVEYVKRWKNIHFFKIERGRE